MVAELTTCEQGVIRDRALIGDAIPLLDGAAQVVYGPGQTVGCGGCRSEERARHVEPQLAREIGELLLGQFGAVAADTMVVKGRNGAVAIGTAPLHQAGAGAAGNLGDLGGRIAQAVQSHRLEPSAIGAVVGRVLGCHQCAGSLVG